MFGAILVGLMELGFPLVHGKRRQHHMDVTSDQLRLCIGVPHAGQISDRTLHHLESKLGVRHLAAAELQPHLHLVSVVEELFRVPQLGLEIVLFDASGKRSEERRVGKECRSRWWSYY